MTIQVISGVIFEAIFTGNTPCSSINRVILTAAACKWKEEKFLRFRPIGSSVQRTVGL